MKKLVLVFKKNCRNFQIKIIVFKKKNIAKIFWGHLRKFLKNREKLKKI